MASHNDPLHWTTNQIIKWFKEQDPSGFFSKTYGNVDGASFAQTPLDVLLSISQAFNTDENLTRRIHRNFHELVKNAQTPRTKTPQPQPSHQTIAPTSAFTPSSSQIPTFASTPVQHANQKNSESGPKKGDNNEVRERALPQLSNKVYDATKKGWNAPEKNWFCAAGIIPMRINPSTGIIELLLSIEPREWGKDEIHILGGKRDPGESIENCAFREFREEIADLIPASDKKNFLSQINRKVWFGPGKYGLILVHGGDDFSFPSLQDLPKKYKQKKNKNFSAEPIALTWQPLSCLLSDSPLPVNDKIYNCSEFVKKLLSNEYLQVILMDIRAEIEKFVLTQLIEREINNCNEENRLLKSDQVGAVMKLLHLEKPKNFKSPADLIQLPKSPPKPLISLLSPNDTFYKEIFALIPPTFQGRVQAIRKAGVPSRMLKWNMTLQKHQATKHGKYLFHGTPDTWRATAISYHGFDLKIRLHGRALGDGAYSTEQFEMAAGYAAANGTVIVMQGMTGGTVKVSGSPPVYVFPDVDCVVPVALIDFGTVGNDEYYQKETAEQEKQYKASLAKMEQDVNTFLSEFVNRAKTVNQRYLERIEIWKKEYATNGDAERILALLRREAYQKKLMLPIYMKKAEIIRHCKQNQLVIIGAATGSGKSTQIPQYLLDHVVASDQKVIVLQPRRVNAERLAERVCEERGLVLGEEVGWKTGHGRGVFSKNTRLLFMTHGLFAENMLRNADGYLEGVGAIVIDEAHERSLDVDICFALLKQRLSEQQAKNLPEISIVVTSATIQEESEKYKNFLIGNNDISCTVEKKLPGITFPVHIEHRQLVSVDAAQIGTGGSAAVHLSAAVQAAVELLQSTTTGNILVFVPGKSEALKGKKEIEGLLSSNLLDIGLTKLGIKQSAIEIFAISAESSELDKQRLFKSKAKRLVIFGTNLLETGLTMPVNYVIDVGQNRSAEWQIEYGMTILTTNWISKSSAIQRAGRAGRIAPGYCLRLYSKDEYDNLDPSIKPAIDQSCIEKTVLTLHKIAELANYRITPQQFELLTPIKPEIFNTTVAKLKKHSLLEADPTRNGQHRLTAHGKLVLQLGVDIKYAAFLIACSTYGFGYGGVVITAMHVAGAERLLITNPKNPRLLKLIDGAGDHFSLYLIFQVYLQKKGKNKHHQWIHNCELSNYVLNDADKIFHFLLDTAGNLGLSVNNNPTQPKEEKQDLVQKALCCAFCDQVAVPAQLKNSRKFVRLLSDADKQIWQDLHNKFDPNAAPANPQGENSFQATVDVSSNSAIMLKPPPEDEGKELVIFTGIVQTDKNASPTVDGISFVSKANLESISADWCKQVNLNGLLKDAKRFTNKFPVDHKTWASNRSQKLRELQRKFPLASISLEKLPASGGKAPAKGQLTVTANGSDLTRIDAIIGRIVAENAPETKVNINLEGVNEKAFRAFKKDFQRIRTDIQNFWQSQKGETGSISLDMAENPNRIEVLCRYSAKSLIHAIVGQVQLELNKKQISNNLSHSNSQPCTPARLTMLLNNAPIQITDGNSTLLKIARFFLSQKCSVYGGFLRDWVFLNKPPTDIDVCAMVGGVNLASLIQQSQQFGAQNNLKFEQTGHGRPIGHGKLGTLYQFTFTGPYGKVDIDFVLLQKRSDKCDADVNNLLVNSDGLIQKSPTPAYSIADSLRNIEAMTFNFYMEFGTNPADAARRAAKLIDKGFTCLSGIPPAHKKLFSPKQLQSIK